MSKILMAAIATLAIIVGGGFFFLTHSFGPAPGAAFLPAVVWAGACVVAALLVGVQWTVYTTVEHPDKFARLYAKYVADPRLDAEVLAKKLDRELADLKSRVLAELSRLSQ